MQKDFIKERFLITRWELFLLLAFILASLGIRLFFLGYPLLKDADDYVRLGHVFFTTGVYGLSEDQPQLKYPPGFPVLIGLASSVFGAPYLSAKIISFIFSGLTTGLVYLLGLRLLKHSLLSLLAALSLLFSPWHFYFSTISGLSEGVGCFYVTLIFYLLWHDLSFQKKKLPLFIGLVLGIAILTRLAFVGLGLVFAFIYGVQFLFKKRKESFWFFVGLGFLTIPWFVYQAQQPSAVKIYVDYFSHSILVYPYTLIFFVLFVTPLSLHGLSLWTPNFIRRIVQSRDCYWLIVLCGFLIHLMVSCLAWDLGHHVGLIQDPWGSFGINFNTGLLVTTLVAATRYVVPFLPLLILGVLYHAPLRGPEGTVKKKFLLAMILLAGLSMTFFMSSGRLQLFVGSHVKIPHTFVQESIMAHELLAVLEDKKLFEQPLEWQVAHNDLYHVVNATALQSYGRNLNIKDLNSSSGVKITDKNCPSKESKNDSGCIKTECYYSVNELYHLSMFWCEK